MATRVGIELAPATCRIVEVAGRLTGSRAGKTRVRSYAVLPADGTEFREKLNALRRREAAVVVWGARSVHHQMFVPEHPYEQMREDALALARDAGAETAGMLADIAPSGASQKGNRPVLLAMGCADDLALAVRPLLDAGMHVKSITTPCGALTSLARVRREIALPQHIEAYIALEETTTATALVRDGALVAAREWAWGFLADTSPTSERLRKEPTSQRPREEIVTRLIEAIAGLCATIAIDPASIAQMAICGSLAELRSVAALMTERIDLEVEPLDSLFAIDSARLPEPSDDFRERSAEMRLAWAVVADWPTPLNFMRYPQRQAARARLARAVVVAGVGVGLGGGWMIARSGWVQSTGEAARAASSRPLEQVNARQPQSKPQSEQLTRRVSPPEQTAPATPAGAPPPPPAAVTRGIPLVPPPPPAAVTRGIPLVPPPPPAAVTRGIPLVPPPPPAAVTRAAPIVSPPPAAVTRAMPPISLPPPLRVQAPTSRPPAAVPQPSVQPGSTVAGAAPSLALPATRVPPSPAATRPTLSTPLRAPTTQTSTVARLPVATGEPNIPLARPQLPPARRGRPQAAAVPFDAVLGTILYSADRRLAIIDGRIVGVGEEVKGARVTDISPNVVTLRDSQGQLRTLTLASAGP